MNLLLATKNKAKIKYYGNQIKDRGINIVTLDDLKIDIDVEENGNNPLENSIIKAKEYARISGYITIAIDEGLFFDGVSDDLQPGTHVRRVNGKRLNDEEMIEHYISLVNKYGTDGKLKGYFLKAISLVNGDEVYSFESKSSRTFLNNTSKKIVEGYPLSSIQFIDKYNKYKSELSPDEEIDIKYAEQIELVDFIEKIYKEIQSKVKIKKR